MNEKYRIDEAGADFQDMVGTVAGWKLDNGNGKRLDAGETAMIVRQLLQVKAKTYDVKYPMFKARDFIPVSNEISNGAESWAYHQWDMYGMAKIIANYATDFPRVDVTAAELQMPIKSLGDSYAYTVQDLRRAAFAGVQLQSKKAAAARRFIEAAIDDLAAVGNADAGWTGFTNNTNVPILAAPTGSWATATALEIIGDLNALTQKVITQSNEVEHPDAIILPTAEFGIATMTPFSTLGDRTIATWFVANNPYITDLDQWIKLNKANAGNTAGRCVAYRRDAEVVSMEIPQEFEQFAPEVEGMAYKVACHARFGGVAWYYPLAGCYMDGSS